MFPRMSMCFYQAFTVKMKVGGDVELKKATSNLHLKQPDKRVIWTDYTPEALSIKRNAATSQADASKTGEMSVQIKIFFDFFKSEEKQVTKLRTIPIKPIGDTDIKPPIQNSIRQMVSSASF